MRGKTLVWGPESGIMGMLFKRNPLCFGLRFGRSWVMIGLRFF